MAKNESVQRRLQRVRAPRVQMTYDVEVGDVVENKELPFVVGVLGDFGGTAKKRLKERSFVAIDSGNFDEVMASTMPELHCKVPNMLDGQGGELAVALNFQAMEDFRPEAIVKQVPVLHDLLEARTRLADLRNKLAGNDKLEDILAEVLGNTERLQQLHAASKPEEK